jgi:hypothetical protein
MTYNQLPNQIISPLTGKTLHLMPIGYPNEIDGMNIENHIHTYYDGSPGDWFQGPVAMYKSDEGPIKNSEILYYPFK